MIQFSLKSSVGKAGANKPADVLAVQTCLAAIKVKMKPLYRGKVDGKASKELIETICLFQQMERIKATGKIMPGDQTVSKLKMRTPSSANAALQSNLIGVTLPATSFGARAKISSRADTLARSMKTHSPLPKQQADALAKIVMQAGLKGIPLNRVATDITEDGRYAVEFSINASSLPSTLQGAEGARLLKEVFKLVISITSIWRQPNPHHFKLVTTQSFDYLRNVGAPSDDYLIRYDINRSTATPTELRLAAAAERAEEADLL